SDALVDGRRRLEEFVEVVHDNRPTGNTPPMIDGPVLDRVLNNIVPDDPPPLSDDALDQTLRDLEQPE
ncbi:MAG: hypothetical protein AB8G16_19565, partial [Gammaproteobacteria bacterium]